MYCRYREHFDNCSKLWLCSESLMKICKIFISIQVCVVYHENVFNYHMIFSVCVVFCSTACPVRSRSSPRPSACPMVSTTGTPSLSAFSARAAPSAWWVSASWRCRGNCSALSSARRKSWHLREHLQSSTTKSWSHNPSVYNHWWCFRLFSGTTTTSFKLC